MSLKKTGIINKLDTLKMASGLFNFLFLSVSSHSGREALALRKAQTKKTASRRSVPVHSRWLPTVLTAMYT